MRLPERLDHVVIALWHGTIEIPWASRVELLDEIGHLGGGDDVIHAFNTAGASAPVRLGRTGKDTLVQAIDKWTTEVNQEELPAGVWELRCALVDDLAAEAE